MTDSNGTMAHADLQRAAAFWGDADRAAFYAAGGLMWGQLGAVQRRINAKISGDADVDWVDHLRMTHLAGRTPVPRALSLCCGDGTVERDLAARGILTHCLGLDLSPGAIQRAQHLATECRQAHLEYEVCDANTMELLDDQFDLIVARAALHHVTALEHVANQLNRALRPGGLFVSLEYVGPSRFGYSRRQRDLCTAALRLLPERFRRSVSWQRVGRIGPGAKRSSAAWARLLWLKVRNGTLPEAISRRIVHAWLRRTGRPVVKRCVPRIVGSEMAIDDPTEAVRSAEILSVLERALQVVECKRYGGTILMPLLDDIAGNFESGDPAAEQLVQMLFCIEDAVLAGGELDSDFAYTVATRR